MNKSFKRKVAGTCITSRVNLRIGTPLSWSNSRMMQTCQCCHTKTFQDSGEQINKKASRGCQLGSLLLLYINMSPQYGNGIPRMLAGQGSQNPPILQCQVETLSLRPYAQYSQ